jgi:hypothetical protein
MSGYVATLPIRRRAIVVCLALLLALPVARSSGQDRHDNANPASQASASMNPRPSIVSQTVMLYYDDLNAPETFYGEQLGLEKTRDFGWAKFFRVSAGAEVGIVKSGPGAYFTPQPRNAVMLSIVTSDVDAWYARLKSQHDIVFLVDIHTSDTAPIRNFMVQDPGGYAVEFFQWLEPR